MHGRGANPIFVQTLEKKSAQPIRSFFRDIFSVGSISYYMRDMDGWQTRIFLHNYFPLLNDGPFPAAWELSLYGKDGRFVTRLDGTLTGAETAVIDVQDIDGLDDFGLVYGHIKPNASDVFFGRPYASVHFSEYYKQGVEESVHAHSLSGALKANHYEFYRLGTGFTTPPGFRPYLFLANACAFQRFGHPACGGGTLTFINHAGQKEIVALNSLRPRACERIDVFARWPKLRDHLGSAPYSIEIIKGKNILAIPFIFQTDGTRVLAEHM